jgi:hypothetical protein
VSFLFRREAAVAVPAAATAAPPAIDLEVPAALETATFAAG